MYTVLCRPTVRICVLCVLFLLDCWTKHSHRKLRLATVLNDLCMKSSAVTVLFCVNNYLTTLRIIKQNTSMMHNIYVFSKRSRFIGRVSFVSLLNYRIFDIRANFVQIKVRTMCNTCLILYAQNYSVNRTWSKKLTLTLT